jgi:hypothetical protein
MVSPAIRRKFLRCYQMIKSSLKSYLSAGRYNREDNESNELESEEFRKD